MEGIHAEVYQRVLLEHEEHARMYATNIDVSKDIIAAVEKMESGIYTPNAE